MNDSEIKRIEQSLQPIYTEANYDRTVNMMNALLDVAGDDKDHPLSSLLELVTALVSGCERLIISFSFIFWPVNAYDARRSYVAP